jgi:ABC-2 type transport system permease protein
LATSTSRIGWAASHVVFMVGGTAVLLLAAGLLTGLVQGAHDGTIGHTVGRDLAAALAQLPAAWVVGAIGVLLFGLLPRLAAASWAAVVIVVLVGELGPTLRLPQAVLDISPYTHLPKLPGGTVTAAPILWLLGIAVVLTVAGLIGFRRRDLAAE